MKYTCPCCGYKVFSEPPGSDDICPICFWEDDIVQYDDPTYSGGANKPSLIEAQHNFQKFGAIEKDFTSFVRKPDSTDIKDDKWVPL